MGKGEIARNEQFFLFSQCFQKAYFPGASRGVIVLEWVKHQTLGFYYRLGSFISRIQQDKRRTDKPKGIFACPRLNVCP